MLSDDKFDKEIKKFDKYLFLGRQIVIRDGEYFNAPAIYYQKHTRLVPEVVKVLKAAPCWGDIDDLKRMDSWAWKKDWKKTIDDYNDAVKRRSMNAGQDEIDQVSKDVYTLANRLERYGDMA